jgi:hypothetical protein
VPKAWRQREIFFLLGRGRSADGDGPFADWIPHERFSSRPTSDLARASDRTGPLGSRGLPDLALRTRPNRSADLHHRHRRPHSLTDCPDEAAELAGDRGDDGGLLACGSELTIAAAKTNLRLPCDVPYRLWLALHNVGLARRDARLVAIAPAGFYQHAASLAVASPSDPAAPDAATARLLGRNQAEISHELTGRLEASEISYGRHEDIPNLPGLRGQRFRDPTNDSLNDAGADAQLPADLEDAVPIGP